MMHKYVQSFCKEISVGCQNIRIMNFHMILVEIKPYWNLFDNMYDVWYTYMYNLDYMHEFSSILIIKNGDLPNIHSFKLHDQCRGQKSKRLVGQLFLPWNTTRPHGMAFLPHPVKTAYDYITWKLKKKFKLKVLKLWTPIQHMGTLKITKVRNVWGKT